MYSHISIIQPVV